MATTTLPDRLRQARTLGEDLGARELDRIADISEGHTSLIEAGSRPRLEMKTAQALAKALGVTLDWLIAGEGKAPSQRAVRAAVEVARAEWVRKQPEATASHDDVDAKHTGTGAR